MPAMEIVGPPSHLSLIQALRLAEDRFPKALEPGKKQFSFIVRGLR